MLKSLRKLLGLGTAEPSTASNSAIPYRHPEFNFIYNLLFCDQRQLFAPNDGQAPTTWQTALFGPASSPEAIIAIAQDKSEESRIRALAYNWLREHSSPVVGREILGVIVEVPLEQGLDVLAAYSDGRVRYINQSGKLAVFEGGPPEVEALAKSLVATSEFIVSKIGPWEQPRLPPPKAGNIRMTFLVSDGLYFGEGPFALMAKDQMAGPLIRQATQLLQLVVKIGTA